MVWSAVSDSLMSLCAYLSLLLVGTYHHPRHATQHSPPFSVTMTSGGTPVRRRSCAAKFLPNWMHGHQKARQQVPQSPSFGQQSEQPVVQPDVNTRAAAMMVPGAECSEWSCMHTKRDDVSLLLLLQAQGVCRGTACATSACSRAGDHALGC